MDKRADDSELVQRAVHGDTEAYGTLYELHLDAIYRYVFYRAGNVHDAEDLTETVFLRGWQAIGSYVVNGVPFRAWLYRIAHNCVVDHYRGRRPAEPLALYANLEDERPHLDDRVAVNEQMRRLVAAVRQLSPQHQHVLILRFVEGLSHDEVAGVLKRRVGAV
ncbi:MAG: sigma-70 family RNA polymerase sigma factor, partial [Anaerolineales bacterium]|nr:sigma-70 family RNA polymerase sigma factor [Anaerolineales bacterium]